MWTVGPRVHECELWVHEVAECGLWVHEVRECGLWVHEVPRVWTVGPGDLPRHRTVAQTRAARQPADQDRLGPAVQGPRRSAAFTSLTDIVNR